MSGGGKTVRRGGMGRSAVATTTDPAEIRRMESDLFKIEERLRHLQQEQTKLEQQILALESELREMKFSLEKGTEELKV